MNLTSWFASPPPDAAIEIAPERVSAAALTPRGGSPVLQAHASEALPAGAVVPAFIGHNVADRAAVARAVKLVVDRLGTKPRRVALVIPDLTARVAILRFEQVPARREDLDQLVRWQLRKAAPFPIEDACVTYSRGARGRDGSDFITVLARRDVVREYEEACEAVNLHAGLVDVATLAVLNLFGAGTAPAGDWMVVHMRPEYTSLAIMRDDDVIFFRNRPEGEDESLGDLVHQTAMYYQDRLAGQGFARVLLGGAGRAPGAVEAARGDLEERLGVAVEPIDPTHVVSMTDRIPAGGDVRDVLAPLVGLLLRTRSQAVTA